MVSCDHDFMASWQRIEPIGKGLEVLGISIDRRVPCENEEITFRDFNAFMPFMGVT